MYISKDQHSSASKRRRLGLPKVWAPLVILVVGGFIAMFAVAPFTTTSAVAEEYAPLAPGETLSQTLMTEATANSSFTIEAFEEVVAPAAAAVKPGGGAAPAAGTPDPGSAQAIAMGYVGGGAEFDCLVALWNKESRWNVYSHNTSSGAYGIPQALPGAKMASAGADWATNPDTQIRWGLGYIKGRYGSPCAAWAHSQSVGWY